MDEEMLGKPFYFSLEIKDGRIPENFNEVFVEYSVKLDEN